MDSEGGLMPLIGKMGLGATLLALFLAPLIGGSPSGTTYGADVTLDAIRALVVLAAACVAITDGPSAPGPLTPCPSLASERGESKRVLHLPYAIAEDAAIIRLPSFACERGAGGERAGGRGTICAVWALFAWTLLSLLVHSRGLTSPVLLFAQLPATLDWLCYALVFTLSGVLVRRDRRNLVMIVAAVGAGTAFAALTGAWNHLTGAPGERVAGTFFDPNFLAGFLALGLPLLVAGMFAAPKTAIPIGLGALVGVTLGALAATGSRAGLAIGVGSAAITVGLAALWRTRLCKRRVVLLVVGGLAFLWAFRAPLVARVGGTAGASQEHSGAFRKETWRGTVRMATANPVFGTGPGTFPDRYPPYAIVEKSGLAHSSFLQLAAEQGFPAVCALAALLLALLAAAGGTLRQMCPADSVGSGFSRTEKLLFCGVVGAVIAGFARSLADSEWSILGNALPFWAIAGLAAADLRPRSSEETAHPATDSPTRRGGLYAVALLPALGLALLLLHNAQAVDAARPQSGQTAPPDFPTVWPPEPDILAWSGHPDAAATVEPSGARFYRLGAAQAHGGDLRAAVASFEQATRLDPNALQSWRTLAETDEKAGDHAAALAAWRELVRRYEGPSGKILAIPELPEKHPAFAYAALGDDAAATPGQTDAARAFYGKAAAVVEAYSQTPPVYQRMEAASAALRGADIDDQRAQIKSLYERVMTALAALPGVDTAEVAALQHRREETLARLDRFVGVSAETTIH